MLILAIVFLVGCTASEVRTTEPIVTPEPTPPTTPLTTELKAEICRDVQEFMTYCFDTGVSSDDCAEQLFEKIPRVYELTIAQSQEVIQSCNP